MCDFLVFSLPRSGSAWLANLFTTDECLCYHELTSKTMGLLNFQVACREGKKKYKKLGNSDSGNLFLLPFYAEMYPEAKILVIDRNVEAVHQSMLEQGIDNRRVLEQTQKALRMLGRQNKMIDFSSIFDEDVMVGIWDYLEIPAKWNSHRFHMLCDYVINIRAADAKELKSTSEEVDSHMQLDMKNLIERTAQYVMEV